MPPLNQIKLARRNIECAINLSKRRKWHTDPPPAGDPPAPATPPVVPPTPDPKGDAKFTQAELDAIAGRTRKEASDATLKKLLQDFGADPNDPKAMDSLKARLKAADDAEKAKMTAEEKALARITELEKERDEAKAEREAARKEAQIKDRNAEIKDALASAKCNNPVKVMALVTAMQADELKATLNEDGTVNKAAVTKLVDTAKKEHREYFVGGGPGSPSNAVGRASDPDAGDTQKATATLQKRLRNSF